MFNFLSALLKASAPRLAALLSPASRGRSGHSSLGTSLLGRVRAGLLSHSFSRHACVCVCVCVCVFGPERTEGPVQVFEPKAPVPVRLSLASPELGW